MPPELEEPELPEIYEDLWHIFWDLRCGQQLSYTEIHWYCELNKYEMDAGIASLLMWMNSVVDNKIKEIQSV